MNKFSIIIPAYNEEQSIRQTITSLTDFLQIKYQKDDYEIIIINDASTDKTKEILEGISDIKIIHHSRNMGYGASLKDGIKQAQYEWIVITDGDGTYPIQSIPDLLSFAGQFDMAVGQRTGQNTDSRFLQKPAKYVLRCLSQYLTETKIPDLNSGLRVFRKKDSLKFWNFYPKGFSFTTTITLAYLTNNLSIKYVPINYYKRSGKSSIKPIRDFKSFFNLILNMILFFRPMKIFVPISFLFLAISALIGLWSYLYAPKFMDTTVAIIAVFSIQTFFFGLLAELIVKSNIKNKND